MKYIKMRYWWEELNRWLITFGKVNDCYFILPAIGWLVYYSELRVAWLCYYIGITRVPTPPMTFANCQHVNLQDGVCIGCGATWYDIAQAEQIKAEERERMERK